MFDFVADDGFYVIITQSDCRKRLQNVDCLNGFCGLQKLVDMRFEFLYQIFKNRKFEFNCVFFGNQPPEQMPALMNCINVLVLPSLNEGMPLVTMEALNCGCNAVGSRVGGIPEILGEENTVPLGQDFTSQMAQKIYEFLLEPKDQLHGRGFGWDATARIEDAAYKKILG